MLENQRKGEFMKDTLVLQNGVEIALEAGAGLGALRVYSTSREGMVSTWQQLTENNLQSVQIRNSAGLVVGTYKNLVLVSETSVTAFNGGVETVFCLREKTIEELRLDALEEGQDVQNGAIDDLGAVTSVLAGQMEGGES